MLHYACYAFLLQLKKWRYYGVVGNHKVTIHPLFFNCLLFFPVVFMLPEGNDQKVLTNSVRALYQIDQSWHVRMWDHFEVWEILKCIILLKCIKILLLTFFFFFIRIFYIYTYIRDSW